MVEHLMRIALLIERRYAPYEKWLGTAFSRLPCASALSSNLEEVLAARNWKEREDALFRACCSLGVQSRHLVDRIDDESVWL